MYAFFTVASKLDLIPKYLPLVTQDVVEPFKLEVAWGGFAAAIVRFPFTAF